VKKDEAPARVQGRNYRTAPLALQGTPPEPSKSSVTFHDRTPRTCNGPTEVRTFGGIYRAFGATTPCQAQRPYAEDRAVVQIREARDADWPAIYPIVAATTADARTYADPSTPLPMRPARSG
jgi:hypothetical protein